MHAPGRFPAGALAPARALWVPLGGAGDDDDDLAAGDGQGWRGAAQGSGRGESRSADRRGEQHEDDGDEGWYGEVRCFVLGSRGAPQRGCRGSRPPAGSALLLFACVGRRCASGCGYTRPRSRIARARCWTPPPPPAAPGSTRVSRRDDARCSALSLHNPARRSGPRPPCCCCLSCTALLALITTNVQQVAPPFAPCVALARAAPGPVAVTSISSQVRRLQVVGGACDAVVQRAVAAAALLPPTAFLPLDAHASSATTTTTTASPHAASSSSSSGREAASTGDVLWQSVCAWGARERASAGAGSAEPPRGAGGAPWAWPDGCVLGVTAADPRLLALPPHHNAATAAAAGGGVAAAAAPSRLLDAGLRREVRREAPALMAPRELQRALRAWPESGERSRFGAAAPPVLFLPPPLLCSRRRSRGAAPEAAGGVRRRFATLAGDWTDGAHALLHAPSAGDASPPAPGLGAPQRQQAGAAVTPPAPQAALGERRRRARHAAMLLPPARGEGAAAAAAAAACAADRCPVLLVRSYVGQLPGWSLVLPAGWVMPFWTALIHAGQSAFVPGSPWRGPRQHLAPWRLRHARHDCDVCAACARRRQGGGAARVAVGVR